MLTPKIKEIVVTQGQASCFQRAVILHVFSVLKEMQSCFF